MKDNAKVVCGIDPESIPQTTWVLLWQFVRCIQHDFLVIQEITIVSQNYENNHPKNQVLLYLPSKNLATFTCFDFIKSSPETIF